MKREKDRLHRVVVIGATPAGITATNKLGELGIPVTLLDRDADLDKKLGSEKWALDSGVPLNHAHRPGLIRIMRNSDIETVLPARVASIRHNPQGFKVSYVKEQTFVDADRCTLCGNCREVCPVEHAAGEKAVTSFRRQALPGRPAIDKRKAPLCQESCPLGVNAQGYIALAREGKYREALELIRKRNVLPGICGRICHHPCEAACRRGDLDDPVSIRSIKRFLADYELENPPGKGSSEAGAGGVSGAGGVAGADAVSGTADVPGAAGGLEGRKEKIVVVGSGPSGLAAAAVLAENGCKVTILEREAAAGGLLRYGIGSHRLPKEILDVEIDAIRAMGVTIRTSSPVDLEKDLPRLNQAYDAVLLSTGAWKDRALGVPGEDLQGVEGCLSFLGRFHRGEVPELKEKVAVIGDGNGAFDLARTLLRLGADVTLVSWFAEDKIPADEEEIVAAREEKIPVVDGTQVVEFVGEGGKFTHLLVKPTRLGEPGADGMAWPVIEEGSEASELPFDRVFVAIGQMGTLSEDKEGLGVSGPGYITVDDRFRTTMEGVYATGDGAFGPSTVVGAMARGRDAAAHVLLDLCDIPLPPEAGRRVSDKEFPMIGEDVPTLSRCAMPERQPGKRESGFAEVALGLSPAQVREEAERCLNCGVCSECLQCETVCGAMDALNHGELEEEVAQNCGVVIIADPDMAPSVKGDDVIRAYGPKSSRTDVNAMMTRGFAAAARAMVLLGRTFRIQKGRGLSFARSGPGLLPDVRTGVFVCKCNESLGWTDGMQQYVENLPGQCGVVHAETIPSACVPEGVHAIVRAVREKGITRVVLGSCVCCPLNFVCSACTDQRSRLKHALFTATGIGRSMTETCNIRGEALSMIEGRPEEAEERFKGLIHRSVKRAAKLSQFASPERIYNFTTAVIGESEAALNSAVTLADAGMDVVLFGNSGKKEGAEVDHPNILAFPGMFPSRFSGVLGDFHVTFDSDGIPQTLQVGAVILGEKARKKLEYIHQEGLAGSPVTAFMQKAGITGIPFSYPGMTSVAGLFLAEPPGMSVSSLKKGAAAAVLAAAVMPRQPRQSKGFTVVVDDSRCRGCGRCVNVCNYRAIGMDENDMGGWRAVVDEALCKGCGNCISVCPSNAADSPYRNQGFLENALEEVLLG